MKRIIILTFSLLFLFSCSKSRIITEEFVPDNILTKAGLTEEDLLTENVVVTEEHILDYISFKEKAKDYQENNVLGITPVEEDGNLVYYVIQYERGWELVSADMRGPIVLAHSEEGTYEESMSNEEVSAWMSTIAGEIVQRKLDNKHYDNIDKETLELEASSVTFWKLVTGDKDYLYRITPHTKPPIEDPIEYDGYWAIIAQYEYTLEDEYVQHLMSTKWDQGAPFNYYCPYRSNDPTKRAPAGCVVIAGAQMLYFLHDLFGVPSTAPTTATSVGNINNHSITVSGASSTIWDDMVVNYDHTRYYDTSYWDECSALIVQIGQLVHVSYGNTKSSADDGDLVSDVFGYNGITCQRGDYNHHTLFTSLKNGMPVIVGADSYNGGGHCFIIDGFRSTKKEHYVDYQWMKYLGNGEYEPEDRYLHEVTYLSPVLQEIYMNWGWGGTNDDTAYAPTGTWIACGNAYALNKKMIYNFAVAQ